MRNEAIREGDVANRVRDGRGVEQLDEDHVIPTCIEVERDIGWRQLVDVDRDGDVDSHSGTATRIEQLVADAVGGARVDGLFKGKGRGPGGVREHRVLHWVYERKSTRRLIEVLDRIGQRAPFLGVAHGLVHRVLLQVHLVQSGMAARNLGTIKGRVHAEVGRGKATVVRPQSSQLS